MYKEMCSKSNSYILHLEQKSGEHFLQEINMKIGGIVSGSEKALDRIPVDDDDIYFTRTLRTTGWNESCFTAIFWPIPEGTRSNPSKRRSACSNCTIMICWLYMQANTPKIYSIFQQLQSCAWVLTWRKTYWFIGSFIYPYRPVGDHMASIHPRFDPIHYDYKCVIWICLNRRTTPNPDEIKWIQLMSK